MDYSNIEDLLISYYDGKATADEVREIEAWIKSSDGNKKKAIDIYTLLLMTDAQQVAENIDLNEELTKVKGHMQQVSYSLVELDAARSRVFTYTDDNYYFYFALSIGICCACPYPIIRNPYTAWDDYLI